VRPNPTNKKQPQVVILDHGLYTRISDDFRKRYADFWISAVKNDTAGLKRFGDHYNILHPELLVLLLTWQAFDAVSITGEVAMSEEEIQKLTERFQDKEELKKWDNLGKNIPEEFGFVYRTQMLMRGINQQLGVPVNRFSLQAQVAQQVLEESNLIKKMTFTEKLSWNLRLKATEWTAYFVSWFAWLYSWFTRSSTAAAKPAKQLNQVEDKVTKETKN